MYSDCENGLQRCICVIYCDSAGRERPQELALWLKESFFFPPFNVFTDSTPCTSYFYFLLIQVPSFFFYLIYEAIRSSRTCKVFSFESSTAESRARWYLSRPDRGSVHTSAVKSKYTAVFLPLRFGPPPTVHSCFSLH